MIKKILLIFAILFISIVCVLKYNEQSACQPIKKVYLTKQGDINFFCIDFIDCIKFTPRIHTLQTGMQIIISFNDAVEPPISHKIIHNIINGYFFEQLGISSLMAVVSFKDEVVFTEKKYTKSSIKIGFKIKNKKTIVIDAGHGGKDPGTLCVTKDYEKNVTLVMAVELRNLLRATGRYNVVMTRDRDEFVSTENRKKRIKSSGAEILISLHTDSNNDKNIRGISIYTLPNLDFITKKNERAFFEKNKKNYYKTLSISRKFANILIGYIPNICKIKNRPCRNAELRILKSEIPAILIELGCVSNRKDNMLLHSREFRDKTNNAILYALDEFFQGANFIK